MLRDYELTFILNTSIDEEATTATLERVNQLILNGGGTVTEVHAWGKRHLAYPIEHQRDGFYVTTRFAMPTPGLGAFDNDLRLNENILRHIVLRQDEVPIKPPTPLPSPSAPAAQPQVSGVPSRDAELPAENTVDAVLADVEDELVPAAEEE